MTDRRTITISSALIATALSAAMGVHAHERTIDLDSADMADNAYADRVSDAVSRAKSQAMIRNAAPEIVKTIRVDEALLAAKYAEVPDPDAVTRTLSEILAGDTTEIAAWFQRDNTYNSGLKACYNNCHNACHGSRFGR